MIKIEKKKGFTLVELLTVMSVIAILIGLLVPALNLVKRMAKDTSQRAQLHAIDVALEIFSGENDGYPESSIEGSNPNITVGAQKLCEALIGRDSLGFDPDTTWDAKADENDKEIYASKVVNAKNSSDAQIEDSISRRKGPYLSGENVEAYEIYELYRDPTPTTFNVYKGYDYANDNGSPAPVLTDAYRKKRLTLPNKKNVMAGSPILYYRANTTLTGVDIFPDLEGLNGSAVSVNVATAGSDYIYNVEDNDELINLGKLNEPATEHKYKSSNTDVVTGYNGLETFYSNITNPNITSQVRPYNKDTYLLISAGYDGLYGTADDITNFGR